LFPRRGGVSLDEWEGEHDDTAEPGTLDIVPGDA
jgi:hypothetical protein